jgi:cell division protein FtsL
MALRWLAVCSLLLAVTASALGVVYTQHLSRTQFAEMQALRDRYDRMMTRFGQLQLEQSTWATHGRVERLAREKRQMHIPRFRDVQIVYNAGSGAR